MNIKLLFWVFLALISCKSKNQTSKIDEKFVTETYCPDDGICNLEVLNNKMLIHKFDDSGNIYPELVDGEKIVLKFEYTRNIIPNTADSNYSEELYIQLDSDLLSYDLVNADLQKANVLFARFCYCKGETGYYKIVDGLLKVEKVSSNSYLIDISFNTDLVPQIISRINGTFTI